MPFRINNAVLADPLTGAGMSQEVVSLFPANISLDVSLRSSLSLSVTGHLAGPCDEYQTMPYWPL